MVHRPMCGVVAIGALAVLVLTLSPTGERGDKRKELLANAITITGKVKR